MCICFTLTVNSCNFYVHLQSFRSSFVNLSYFLRRRSKAKMLKTTTHSTVSSQEFFSSSLVFFPCNKYDLLFFSVTDTLVAMYITF